MYMRPRGSGIPRPTWPSMQLEYEDFRPMSSWKQEQGSDVLLVFIPGFMREQIKVSLETSNTVKVSGQRLVGNNIWSRFNQDFNIPEDCNISAISAKIDNGTLTITMPKKIVDSPQVGPEVKAETTQDAPLPPQKAAADDKPKSQMSNQQSDEKIAQIPSPPKATSTMTVMGLEKQRDEKSAGPPSLQKAAVEPKSQKGQEELPPKATSAMKGELPPKASSTMTGMGLKKQRDEKSAGPPSPQKAAVEPKSQKGQEELPPKAPSAMKGELPPKATSTMTGMGLKKQRDEKSAGPPSPQKAAAEPKSHKDQDELPPKATSTMKEELPPKAPSPMKDELPPKATSAMTGIEKQRDEKTAAGSPNTQNAAIEPKPQKGYEEILPPKATSTVSTSGEKQTDKEGIKAPISPQKPVSEPKAQKDEGKSTSPASTSKQTDGKIVGSTNDENVVQKAMEKKERIETIEKAPGEKERESSEKEKGSMAAKEDDPAFVKTEETVASGFNLEKYMKALKDLPMKIREERQSAVNMGAAIAVTVALGAYIFYFGPSEKAGN